jgi:hypothetical protein
MSIIIFLALISAMRLGVYLLMPGPRRLMVFSRSKSTALHGLLGTFGFACYIYMLTQTAEQASMLVWTAVSLVAIGLVLGIAIYAMTRHMHSRPDLILTSHVIFAGMGALVIVALVLV